MNRIIFTLFGKQIIDFCQWSKQAEWQDGPKILFIKNDWKGYLKLYLNDKTKKG